MRISKKVIANCLSVVMSLSFLSYLPYANINAYADDDNDTVNAEVESMVENGLRNKQSSLLVVADQDTTDVDFDTAPENASETMKDIIEITEDRIEKRIKALKKFAKADYNDRKGSYDCEDVSYIVNDPLSSGVSTMGEEVIKLTSLYSVQNDDEVKNSDFDDYLEWLGDKRFFESLTAEDEEGYDNWYSKPKKWYGTMLPQKQFDEAKAAKEAGTYDENDYKDYYTSVVSELYVLDTNIDASIYKETNPDTGEEEIVSVTLTYTIKSLSADEICEDVVKFDEAIPEDEEGNKAVLGSAPYRTEKYKEMVGTGEGEGVTLQYFSDAASTSYTGGNGSGADIVQVAIAEIGTTERTGNNDVKYNDWFYGSAVSGGDYPWCCAFVSWCANECGYIESGIIPKTAGCASMKSFYINKGRTHYVTDSSYTPQPGDFVIMGDNGHIGIVEKYENGILYTIEGNSGPGISVADNNGGCVARHAYGDGQTYSIPGRWGSNGVYCTPEYPVTGGDAALICWMYETGGGVIGQYDLWAHAALQGEGFYNYGAMSANKDGADSLFNYIKSHSTNFNSQMSGLGGWINSSKTDMNSTFNAWWTGSHSDADTREMYNLQSGYTWECYGAVAASGSYAFMARSEVLKAVTISRAIQRGAGGAVDMFRSCGISESMSDRDIVTTIYDYEAAYLTSKEPQYTPAIRARMVKEKETVLSYYF